MSFRQDQLAAIFTIIVLLSVALALLWNQSLQHYLPPDKSTVNFQEGQMIPLTNLGIKSLRPTFVHFVDESCLNSRINLSHLSEFLPGYSQHCDFFIVSTGPIQNERFKKKYDIPDFVQLIGDAEEDILTGLGITATPHVLLVEKNNQLYFQGNYTLNNGLCGPNNIRQSAPAVALRFIRDQKPNPLFPRYQQEPWGCKL